ncbi:hypothetical protein FKW77_004877 [Venturia effusa]|uniref:Uncharacterized protein n=1 Tax=Venturia effusa TaxID=50376 RepID=A0A517LNW2_9PEZI|nr:hypothetical protein FKW77_004877 [Venturia effusa]
MAIQSLSQAALDEAEDEGSWSPTQYFPKNLDCNILQICNNNEPYLETIFLLADERRPDLRFLRDELKRQIEERTFHNSRMAVLEFSNGTLVNAGQPTWPDGPSKLREDWTKEQNPRSRLYVLEDITAGYVEVLGTHFDLDPSFFAKHLRNTTWESSWDAADPSPLPSSNTNTGKTATYCIWYPEMLIFPDEGTELDNHEVSYFCHTNLYRQISWVRGSKRNGWRVGTIMRKVSVAIKDLGDDVWEGLIVVDPPVGNVIFSQQRIKNMMEPVAVPIIKLYKGGFIDFRPWNQQARSATQGRPPGHLSMLDNIIHNAIDPGRDETRNMTVLSTLSFTNQVAVSRWTNLLAYLKEKISKLEWIQERTRTGGKSNWPSNGRHQLDDIETGLQEIGHWRRSTTIYHEWIETNVSDLTRFFDMIQKRKDTYIPYPGKRDWEYLLKTMDGWKNRTNDDVQATFALLSLVEGQKSLDEAENARLLATLGVIYLPFSLAAGILSMNDEFAAGSKHFWTFFAVAFPLLAASLVLAGMPRWQRTISNAWRGREDKLKDRKRKEKKNVVVGKAEV